MSEPIAAPASRNDLCPCGSGKRYKHCHGAIASSAAPARESAGDSTLVAVMTAALEAQREERHEAAKRLYDEALTIDPNQADALHMRGVVAFTLNQPEAAIDYIDRAIALGLDNAATRHNRALALEARDAIRSLPAKVEALSAAAAAGSSPANGDTFISPEDVGLLCYYLPQFHRVAENDAWWGLGFTEWTNVRKARPVFSGHHQPRVPSSLGYYDLLDASTRARQADLARAHGITGFCYYHYWFKGRRILEQPLNAVLSSGDPDFPFCVFWANESWRRTWDGGHNEVLLAQTHDSADDIAFIEHLLPVFNDRRYIRVRNQPLLMVYRVDNLPNAAETFERWRETCIRHGEMPPFIVIAETVFLGSPVQFGADASVGFPPHRLNAYWLKATGLDVDPGFSGRLLDYKKVAAWLATEAESDYLHYQCAVPSWDNTARRQFDGTIMAGAEPELFSAWLREAFVRASRDLPAGQRFVFVNAWNEWAEGAYLEPDLHRGEANLKAAWNARFVSNNNRRLANRSPG